MYVLILVVFLSGGTSGGSSVNTMTLGQFNDVKSCEAAAKEATFTPRGKGGGVDAPSWGFVCVRQEGPT